MAPLAKPKTPFAAFLSGSKDSLSIGAGYFPIAVSFGLSALQADLPPYFIFLISLCLYAGASQFIFVSLIAAGGSFVTICLSIILINLRHIFYGNGLLRYLPPQQHLPLPVLAFGLTDEVYATLLAKINRIPLTDREYWYMGLQSGAYAAWLAGTATGALSGTFLKQMSPIIEQSLAFILPALFLALLLRLLPQTSRRLISVALGLSILFYFLMPGYLALVAAMIGTALYAALYHIWQTGRSKGQARC